MNSIFIVLPILIILMFDLGLTLQVSDFVRIVKQPKAMIAGLLGQLIILPLVALGVGLILRLDEIMFIGLLLIACCPGGSASNVFSRLAKGDVALSVSLTTCSSIITLFTLPLIMHFATSRIGEAVGIVLPVGNLLKQNLAVMLVPIIGGIAMRRFCPEAAAKTDKVLSKCAFAALMILITIFFIQNRRVIIDNIATMGLAAGGLILLAIFIAAALCILFRLKNVEKKTIVIEVGMQNAAQAIAVAGSPFVFNNPTIATPAIIYALMMNIVLLTYVLLIKKFERSTI